MTLPFVIDNQTTTMAQVLNGLLPDVAGKPIDIATAYFSISGYRLVREGLHGVGAFRLLTGSDPQTGADVGLRPDDRKALLARLRGDLEAEPFKPETLRLRKAWSTFGEGKDDTALLSAVQSLAEDYPRPASDDGCSGQVLECEDLELICFDYISA